MHKTKKKRGRLPLRIKKKTLTLTFAQFHIKAQIFCHFCLFIRTQVRTHTGSRSLCFVCLFEVIDTNNKNVAAASRSCTSIFRVFLSDEMIVIQSVVTYHISILSQNSRKKFRKPEQKKKTTNFLNPLQLSFVFLKPKKVTKGKQELQKWQNKKKWGATQKRVVRTPPRKPNVFVPRTSPSKPNDSVPLKCLAPRNSSLLRRLRQAKSNNRFTRKTSCRSKAGLPPPPTPRLTQSRMIRCSRLSKIRSIGRRCRWKSFKSPLG